MKRLLFEDEQKLNNFDDSEEKDANLNDFEKTSGENEKELDSAKKERLECLKKLIGMMEDTDKKEKLTNFLELQQDPESKKLDSLFDEYSKNLGDDKAAADLKQRYKDIKDSKQCEDLNLDSYFRKLTESKSVGFYDNIVIPKIKMLKQMNEQNKINNLQCFNSLRKILESFSDYMRCKVVLENMNNFYNKHEEDILMFWQNEAVDFVTESKNTMKSDIDRMVFEYILEGSKKTDAFRKKYYNDFKIYEDLSPKVKALRSIISEHIENSDVSKFYINSNNITSISPYSFTKEVGDKILFGINDNVYMTNKNLTNLTQLTADRISSSKEASTILQLNRFANAIPNYIDMDGIHIPFDDKKEIRIAYNDIDDESTFELDGEEIAFENIKECLHRMELIYPNKINSKLLFEAYDNIQKLVNMDMINSLTIKTPDDVLNVDIFQIQDKFYTNLRNAKTSWQKFVERVTSDEIRDIVMGWTGYDIQEMTAVQDVTTGLEVDYSKKLYMLTQEINDVNGMIEKLQNNMTSDAIEPLFIPEMEQLHEELINKKEELIEISNRIKSKMISESKKKTGKIDSILNRPLEEPNYDYENKKNKRIIKLKNIQKLGREIEIEDFNCTGVIININIPDNSVTILRKDGKTVDYDITDDIFKTMD